MSSLKMTFSLTSLILIFALAAIPAMAHLATTTNAYVPENHDGKPNNTGDDPAGEIDHKHTAAPTVANPTLVDLKVDTTSSVVGTEVRLVDSAADPSEFTDVVGTKTAAPTTAGVFQVKITFNGPVYADRASPTAAATDLGADDLTITAASQAAPTTNLFVSGGSIAAAVARAADDDKTKDVDESLNTFLVTFTLQPALFGNLSSDPVVASQLPIDVWVTVKENVLFTADGTLDNGEVKEGRGNTASMREKFTVVGMLPTAVTATPSATMVTSGTDIKVGLDPAISGLMAEDFTVTEMDAAGMAYDDAILVVSDDGDMLTITPSATAMADTTVMVAVSTASMSKLIFTAVSVNVDRTIPTITFPDTAPTTATVGSEVMLPFTVTNMMGAGTIAAADIDVVHTAGTPSVETALAVGPAAYDAAGMGMIKFTPDAVGSVVVTIRADVLMDSTGVGNAEVMSSPITVSMPPDTEDPTVVITITPASDMTVSGTTYMDVLSVELDFSEPINAGTLVAKIGRVAGDNYLVVQISNPMVNPLDNTIYTLHVNSPGYRTREETRVLLKRGVADMAGNDIKADQYGVYTPPEVDPPEVTITAEGYLDSLENVVGLNCFSGNTINFEIENTDEALAKGDVTVSTGWKISVTDDDPSNGDIDIVPDGSAAIGVTEVTVTVAEDVLGDHDAQTATFTVGPVLTIPAGGFILVVHPEHDGMPPTTHLRGNTTGRPLIVGSLPVINPDTSIQHWECMPDLTIFYRRTPPGIGGGAIIVKESAANNSTTNPVGVGSVGISEIMWGSDEGIPHGGIAPTDAIGGRRAQGNLDQTREQWIELHNLNAYEVKVTLFALPTDYTRTLGTEIDRASNFELNRHWDVPGSSGNSDLGHPFISMQRGKHDNAGLAPTAAQGYNHGDWNGTHPNRWTASTHVYLRSRAALWQTLEPENQIYDYRGTPGRDNKPTATAPLLRTNVPSNTIIINEVANRRDQTLEWIELKNVSDAKVNLKNYEITLVTATGNDNSHEFYQFPGNDDIQLEAGEILLLLDSDPRDNDNHPIEVAFNRDGGNDQALGIGADAIKYKVGNFREGGLPDDGNFILLLRNAHDKTDSGDAHVIDVVGWSPHLTDASIHTSLWPLKVIPNPHDNNKAANKIAVETVHYRQHRIDPDETTHGDRKVEHLALRDAGYTGIGYKRHAQNIAAHAGTPGHEDTRKNLVADVAATGTLTISEIMYDQGDGEYPQWIEIYNSSATQPVNLHSEAGWRLLIENFDDGEIPVATLSGTLNFKNSEVQTILPQQTVLVASTRARNSGSAFFDTRVVFPDTRVFSVWADQRDELGMKRSTDPILSEEGFYIELIDGKGNFSDGVGNLVKSPNRRVAATIEWALSDVNGGMEEDMGRSSILRKYREYKDGKLVGRYTDAEIEDMGVMADGWAAAYMTDFRDVRQTWYGHPGDYGSPGITGGRVLPVSLSKFRPERLESGEVVIRWITESELNNAGFNILRSEKSDGQFTQINTSLIAGKGTTSERHTYEWKDTSAKPNVVYYYQIQDVSLDGKVQTLRQSRLKGDVSPAGKLTTQWAELKALQ